MALSNTKPLPSFAQSSLASATEPQAFAKPEKHVILLNAIPRLA
jgi:hypothetical protein